MDLLRCARFGDLAMLSDMRDSAAHKQACGTLQERSYILGEARKRFRDNAGSLDGDDTAKMVCSVVPCTACNKAQNFSNPDEVSCCIAFYLILRSPCRLGRARSAWSMQFTTGVTPSCIVADGKAR